MLFFFFLFFCFFLLIIFKLVSSSTIYIKYYIFITFFIFSPEILHNVHICSQKQCLWHTYPIFFLPNLIYNLQTTLISTKYNQKNNIKLNSTSTETYILLQRGKSLQSKLNGKMRLLSCAK